MDRLLAGQPEELEVSLSGLPDQLDELLGVYEDLFELRDYEVINVERPLDDLWIAQLQRRSSSRTIRTSTSNSRKGTR